MNDRISIVIADENQATIEEILQKIQKEKFEVVGTATDGVSLLQLIRDNKPSVVIMDLVLPQLDGFAVMEKIKQENIQSNIIIHTSLSLNGFIGKSMKLGAKYYAVKPFSVDVLLERVEEICLNVEEINEQGVGLTTTNHLEEKITNIFITVGIPAHIKGYQFLREAIKLAISNPSIINSITKKLYPSIAEKFSTSASKVERAIRHAIEVAWNRGKIENINSVFGLKVYSSNEKPTNGEFIALVADKMLIEGAC